MKLPILHLCIFVLLACAGAAEETPWFFPDDNYKALGEPKLTAAAVNPVLEPASQSNLKIILSNTGRLRELIPVASGGLPSDVLQEALEEIHNADASNITARLLGTGAVAVTSGPKRIEYLPSDGIAFLVFNISTEEGAEGWYRLVLELEYERQVDVKVAQGSASSLVQPRSAAKEISILVQSPNKPVQLKGLKSNLYPGANDTIMAVIENSQPRIAKNCSCRLATSPPFLSARRRHILGDLRPGQMAVANFPVIVDKNARPQEYRLAFEITYENRTDMVSAPVTVRDRPGAFAGILAASALFLLIAGGLALWRLRRREGRTLRASKRWPLG